MLKVIKVYSAYNGKQLRAKVSLLGQVKTCFISENKQTVLSIPNFGLTVIGIALDKQSITFSVTQGLKEFSQVTLYVENK